MNTEQAYNILGNVLFAHFDAEEKFDKLEMILEIGDGATASTVWKYYEGQQTSPPLHIDLPLQASLDLNRAAFFLRDNLLETTGEQIWGLTFTLFQDSSFNIEYTYEKSDWLKGDE
ncbi:hypothetical protein [Pseudoalteromonas ardens]|uniref:DUF600 domain-containing protein n=1 Tax=Pseudoalteromonas rubra TaxID=43658 RepID=A0A0L0EXF1_9GAMM|nr:hypothetical protein [Pseudoalteromonas sp. R96]KNC69095.1 hypothetical protein AC626_00905 [Pseudoalteromonas rubra]MDK1310501.1 hypothetical protein [Pseudoalteromonas sp. R96]